MSKFSLRQVLSTILFAATFLTPLFASAGGIVLGGSRFIYPEGAKHSSLSIQNTSDKSTFLVQTWIENAEGIKTPDFIVTPPLYVSGPANENIVRLMYVGNKLPVDRETLYYFNAKAIPSLDKKKVSESNMLLLAAITRIKLFVRPAGLSTTAEKAPESLSFQKKGDKLQINNASPFYITLAEMKVGSKKLNGIMVPPYGSASEKLPSGADTSFTFRTINDYGALTPVKTISLQ